ERRGPGQQHIPFRNSKLTYLLQDALGAENKCLMVVCVSPDEEDSSESLCSLTFAQRVHGVILGAAKAHGGKLDTRAHKEAVLKAKEETKAAEAARALLAEEMAKLQAELHETREAQAAAEREQGHMGLAVAHMQEAHGDQATQWAEEKEKYERALEDAHRQWQAARHAAHRLKEEHHLELEQQRMHVEELMIEKGKLQAQLAAATSAPPSLARTNLTNTTPRRVPVGKEKRDTIREAIHPGAGIPAAAAPATAVAAAAVRDQRVLREKTGPGGETSNCRMGQERGEKSEREDLTKVVPSVKMGGDSAHVKSVDGSSSDGSSNHSTGVRNDSHSHETTANTDGDNLKKRGGTVSDRDLAAPCTEADASDSTSLKRSRAVAEPEGSPGPTPTQNLSSPSAILSSPTPFRPWESNSERNIEAVPEALPTKRQKKVTFMIPSPGPRLPTEGDILEGDPDFGPAREGEREENGPDGAEGGVEASFQHPHYRTTPFKKQEGPELLAPATLGHQVGHGHPATSTSKSVPAPATKNPRPLMMHSNASFGSNHNAPNGVAGGSGYAPLGMPARVMHPSGPTSTSSGPTSALSSAPMRKAAARVPSVPSYKTLGGGSSGTAAVGCSVERTKERVLWSSGNGVNTAPGAGSTRFNENAGKGHSDDKGSGGGRWR
ncbi:Kinesin, motor domain protein, partial [Nannochloropsis gaditana]